MSALAIGDIIPLFLDIGDGEENFKVRAIVTLPDRSVFSQRILTSVGDGLYDDNSLIMPDIDFVKVKYEVFTDATLSTKADYYDVSEVYTRNVSAGGGGGDLDDIKDIVEDAISRVRPFDAIIEVAEEDHIEILVGE